MPPAEKGWHRTSRRPASQTPRAAPCACTAPIAYCEQEGQYRQLAGRYRRLNP